MDTGPTTGGLSMKVLQFPTLKRRQQVNMDRITTLYNLPANVNRLTVSIEDQPNRTQELRP